MNPDWTLTQPLWDFTPHPFAIQYLRVAIFKSFLSSILAKILWNYYDRLRNNFFFSFLCTFFPIDPPSPLRIMLFTKETISDFTRYMVKVIVLILLIRHNIV